MLVLGRKAGESIEIRIPSSESARVVTITITEVRIREGRQPVVKIGFDAPLDIQIVRDDMKEQL
jgi:carbon storage regulator CsrA